MHKEGGAKGKQWNGVGNPAFGMGEAGPSTRSIYTPRGRKVLKMFNCSLSLLVSVELSDARVNVLSIIVFFSVNFSFLDMFLFFKNSVIPAVGRYKCLHNFLTCRN
jgi:hypothetical protein